MKVPSLATKKVVRRETRVVLRGARLPAPVALNSNFDPKVAQAQQPAQQLITYPAVDTRVCHGPTLVGQHGVGLGRQVKRRLARPTIFSLGGRRPGPAHVIFIWWATARPGPARLSPSFFQSCWPSPARLGP